jgi:hypothetical protein
MSYTLIGNNSLLPQVSLSARSRVSVKDVNSPFENDNNTIVVTPKTISGCSVQPLTGDAVKKFESQLSEAGLKSYESYYLWTSDKLVVGIDGTGILSDQVLIDSVTGQQLWFTVLRALSFPYTGVSRYQYLIILEPSAFV